MRWNGEEWDELGRDGTEWEGQAVVYGAGQREQVRSKRFELCS